MNTMTDYEIEEEYDKLSPREIIQLQNSLAYIKERAELTIIAFSLFASYCEEHAPNLRNHKDFEEQYRTIMNELHKIQRAGE